ncbi:MAG TPA: GAF domain-containing sensor histidine kinase [Longimicrobiaceae bacterium]|nr:GAF domain-containing sensor histidine kinase [Longimicrobiaceae bacterium]
MTSKLSPPPAPVEKHGLRELKAAREIAHAFLTAERPTDVYRIALEHVTPLVGASFGCVFLRGSGDESDLLHVVAAFNWPQKYGTYLSKLRVRVGNGPTGRAVAENRTFEVSDVFADPALEDWWESARELGFVSSISLPLAFKGKPAGALTFYYRDPEKFPTENPGLLELVADQLAATAEKAHLIEDLQITNEKLREQNIELEARYREADEARRLKNEFLANVSHELRTPLTAILGYAYLLKEGVSGTLNPEQARAADKIDSSGTDLMRLINDLLDLTHIKLGEIEIDPELTDAISLARATVSDAPEPLAGVEISVVSDESAVPIHTDSSMVLRILKNLVSNALKFTLAGSITIRVRLDQGVNGSSAIEPAPVVVWEISDTGIGIAPEEQKNIFQEFRQVDGSATRRFGGAGLGLTLSQGLAERLGGEISLTSAPGEGSTFTLTLPAGVMRAGRTASTDKKTDD